MENNTELTRVMSLEAAAALMCKLGCLTELLQSKALANVPTALSWKRDEGNGQGVYYLYVM